MYSDEVLLQSPAIAWLVDSFGDVILWQDAAQRDHTHALYILDIRNPQRNDHDTRYMLGGPQSAAGWYLLGPKNEQLRDPPGRELMGRFDTLHAALLAASLMGYPSAHLIGETP